jgi:diketogulonate reductase-like aldo/keto reductase
MARVPDRSLALPSGDRMPVLGQGTWRMAEDPGERDGELGALQLGLELGLTLIDTAEMYAEGGAEELVADAIEGRRADVFLVSKVWPVNATRRGTIDACERSLRRLRTDTIDLYLLHWPSRHPLEGTVEAFTELKEAGKIRHWGVSNFDAHELDELVSVVGGDEVESDQVLYNLSRRQAEFEVLPWCRDRGVPVMAYSPVDRGDLADSRVALEVAEKHGATAAQVALAWLLRNDDVCVIPKASREEHVRENARALDLHLDADDLKRLDGAFPPPTGPAPLDLY